MNVEDIFDADGAAIQAAYALIRTILKADPGVYDDIAAPIQMLLLQRLGSSWRNVPKKRKPRSVK
jgi:hypothetical protein